jgi:hypothetical protein
MPNGAGSRMRDDRARAARRRPRVFLGLTEIAGYYGNLRRGLEELGLSATLVTLSAHPFRYAGESSHWLARWTRSVLRRRVATPTAASARRFLLAAVEGVLRASMFVWAAARFDAFVFGFGTTFLGRPAVELRILRLLGKRVVCVHHGSDSRPPYLDGSLMAADRNRSTADCIALTRATKARVAAVDRFADWVVEHPLAAHFHERPCVQWLAIGIPYVADASARVEGAAATAERPVRVLHSPSHPDAKGTAQIEAAIARLQARGHAIDFIQITGRPHAEVARELARCDLVVDQLYSDTPMAGFATEAANYGKPAVVGGYGADEMRRMIPPPLWPPSAYCHPDELEETLERLVTDAEQRSALGRRAQAFVRRCWSPRRVAERFVRLFDGDVPAEWLFDPREVRYAHGCAVAEVRARALVRDVVALGGAAALQVVDKPDLEAALLDFARGRRDVPAAVCSSSS